MFHLLDGKMFLIFSVIVIGLPQKGDINSQVDSEFKLKRQHYKNDCGKC